METAKRCPRCAKRLSLEAFGFRDKAHTRVQSYCRQCTNTAWREWYTEEGNKAHHLAVLMRRRKARIARNRALVRRLKQEPCADCGNRFPPEAMDFDHLTDKVELISKLVFSVGPERLLEEISKCDVVCAVCHRIRTSARLRGRSS